MTSALRRAARLMIVTAVAWCAAAGVGRAQGQSPPPAAAAATIQAANAKFDPTRDAAADIRAALAEAARTHRRVILDVGGEWCGWCHVLDRYFVAQPELQALRDKNYVWLKINYSPENENQAVLSRYGNIEAYPWLFVLDQEGKLLVSQRTGPLEDGASYSFDRMKAFLTKWSSAAG